MANNYLTSSLAWREVPLLGLQTEDLLRRATCCSAMAAECCAGGNHLEGPSCFSILLFQHCGSHFFVAVGNPGKGSFCVLESEDFSAK